MNNEYFVIINPNAGNGRGKADWPAIKEMLSNQGLAFKSMFTKAVNHARETCIDKINEGQRRFIVVGGDGTLNEVVNGIFSQDSVPPNKFVLGNIPVGTGNDWCRTYNIPNNLAAAVKIISNQNIFHQDIGKVSYMKNGNLESRYFLNVAGCGFDAFVANRTNEKKEMGKGSALVYLYTLFVSLFNYKSTNITIEFEKSKYSELVFSISLGIGRYNGGGMMQLPDAIPNDGLFDLTIIKKMSKIEVLKNIKKLYNGTIVTHPKVDTFKANKVIIKSIPDISLEVDGERCGNSPFVFETINKGLGVLVPELINDNF